MSSVEVALADTDQWLTSCDDAALCAGVNLAFLGQELVQFGSAEALGFGRFRLSRLLRGRAGTEWAQEHEAGETFCLFERNSLQTLNLPGWLRGAEVTAECGGQTVSIRYAAAFTRPPSPAHASAVRNPSGDLEISWVRRSRQGWAWLDEVDAPLGEASERYGVSIAGSLSTAQFEAASPRLVLAPSQVAPLGAGTLLVEIKQLGDHGASRPARLFATI